MSSLNDSVALSSPSKRPFEPSHYQSIGFPPNFKRRKVDAVRQFPRGCGALAPRMRERRTEGITCMATAAKFENEGQGIAVASKPSRISVERDLKSEATRTLLSRDKVGAEGKMTLDNVKMKLPKALENDGLVNVLENGSQPKMDVLCSMKSFLAPQYIDSDMVEAGTPCIVEVKFPKSFKDGLANVLENASQPNIDVLGGMRTLSPPRFVSKTYPPAKIRKGVTVFRQFPPGCGRINQCSSSYSRLLAHKFVAEHQPLVESVRTDRSQTRKEIYGTDTSGNAMKVFLSTVQAGPTSLGNRIHKQVQGETSSKYDGAQKEDREEINTISKTEGDLFQSDCKCQVVSHKICGGKSLIQRIGKDSVKCVKEWGGEDESSAMIQSQEMESPNITPSIGKSVIAEQQQGKMVFSCKLTDSFEGYQHKKLVDVNSKSQDLLQRKQDETRIVAQDSAREGSLICDMNASDQCIYPLLDDNEECKCIIAASNVPSVARFDNCQAVINRNNVREALNLFTEILENLSQEPQPISISKGKGQGVRQIHVEAAMVLKNRGKWINTNGKKLGAVSGVEVGDQFRFRVELAIIGLHRQFVAGIDYMKKDGKLFATSVVASGRYANRAEFSNVLIYSGQGGNQFTKDKQPEDQKLERGNLALKNSMEARTPVRVILGRQQVSKASRIKGASTESLEKTYTYDGLYIVTKYWQERKQHGKLVFMFQLDRIPGQPKLNVLRHSRLISEVKQPYRRSKTAGWTKKLTRFIVDKSKSKKSGLHKDFHVVDDISQGREKIPIRAMNEIDDEKPPIFNYVTKMIFQKVFNHPSPGGCDCSDGCTDPEGCSCARKNGGEIPFNNNGSIIRAKSIVYECGPSCNCPPSCKNRVSQHGIRYQLEVFKTDSRGWGVRSRNYISSGSFVCEYVGELLRDKDAEQRIGNDEYLFDMGNGFASGGGFTIDAAQHGNVGRFINHSCSPNLYAQNILYDHEDKRMPHIMLFAARNIPPLRELTYDYNYKVDQVHDRNGNIKKKNCYCGSQECTGRMY